MQSHNSQASNGFQAMFRFSQFDANSMSAKGIGRLRISAIVDACFRLIVDGKSVLPWWRWRSAQELV